MLVLGRRREDTADTLHAFSESRPGRMLELVEVIKADCPFYLYLYMKRGKWLIHLTDKTHTARNSSTVGSPTLYPEAKLS